MKGLNSWVLQNTEFRPVAFTTFESEESLVSLKVDLIV